MPFLFTFQGSFSEKACNLKQCFHVIEGTLSLSCEMQADLRTLNAKHGSFGDIFEGLGKKMEEQITQLVRDISDKTGNRYQKELKLLPYRS